MTALPHITELTGIYAAKRDTLSELVTHMNDEMERIKTRYLPHLRVAVQVAAEAHDRLHAALESAPELFVKPRTLTLCGIRIGYMKQKGQVVIEDEAAVIARMRKLLPADQTELMIRVRESVHKPAVYDLTAGDLKRLGISVTADEDAVIIKPVDGEVDKLVNALLAEAERSATEAAA